MAPARVSVMTARSEGNVLKLSAQHQQKSSPEKFSMLKKRLLTVQGVAYASLFVLIILCTIMTYYQLGKYLAAQATLAYRVDTSQDFLDFPSISFCPGFKKDKVRELAWPTLYLDPQFTHSNDTREDTFPTTAEEMRKVWDEMTFGPDEIIINFDADYQFSNVSNNETWVNGYVPADLLGKEKVGCLSLKQHDTYSGRCYTFNTWCQVRKTKIRQNKS